jgi:hypothetical protein
VPFVEDLLRGPVCVEARKVLPNDFVCEVSFDPLRTKIPVGDVAIQVQQVNGVVADALHEQAKLLLASVQHLFGGFPFGQVAGDFRKTDDLPGVIADWIDDDVGPEA